MKPVLSHTRFYIEDNNRKPVHFNGKTIGFTCQLFKIYQKNEPKYDTT